MAPKSLRPALLGGALALGSPACGDVPDGSGPGDIKEHTFYGLEEESEVKEGASRGDDMTVPDGATPQEGEPKDLLSLHQQTVGEQKPDAPPCEEHTTRSCKVMLPGQGDVTNCFYGMNLCENGTWSVCIDADEVERRLDRQGD